MVEYAHVQNVRPLHSCAFVTFDQLLSTLGEKDVSGLVMLWDCLLDVRYWVHYLKSQVKRLKYTRVHLNEMVKELFIPLLKGIKQRVLTECLVLVH